MSTSRTSRCRHGDRPGSAASGPVVTSGTILASRRAQPCSSRRGRGPQAGRAPTASAQSSRYSRRCDDVSSPAAPRPRPAQSRAGKNSTPPKSSTTRKPPRCRAARSEADGWTVRRQGIWRDSAGSVPSSSSQAVTSSRGAWAFGDCHMFCAISHREGAWAPFTSSPRSRSASPWPLPRRPTSSRSAMPRSAGTRRIYAADLRGVSARPGRRGGRRHRAGRDRPGARRGVGVRRSLPNTWNVALDALRSASGYWARPSGSIRTEVSGSGGVGVQYVAGRSLQLESGHQRGAVCRCRDR